MVMEMMMLIVMMMVTAMVSNDDADSDDDADGVFMVPLIQGVFNKDSTLNKAREHSLLISNRPPYVTILTLVRDAAARLPNGEGTRAEVRNAFRCARYIRQIGVFITGIR